MSSPFGAMVVLYLVRQPKMRICPVDYAQSFSLVTVDSAHTEQYHLLFPIIVSLKLSVEILKGRVMAEKVRIKYEVTGM